MPSRIKFKLTIAFLLLALGLYYVISAVIAIHGQQTSVDDQIEQIKKMFNVAVIYKNTQQNIPDLWRIPPANVNSIPVVIDNMQRLSNILVSELNKYPADILHDNLTKIIVLGELSFANIPFGGSYLNKSIYLTVGSKNQGYNNIYVAGSIHHEISSILMHNYKFKKTAWSAINKTDFSYDITEEERLHTLKKHLKLDGNQKLYQHGFLTEYNQASLENDLNMYAQFAFTRPDKLSGLAKNYPRIRQKTLLLKEFYLGISKEFEPVMALCCNV